MNQRSPSVINEIIVHLNDSKYANHDANVIDGWHKERKETTSQGWAVAPDGDLRYIGYHIVILFDGTVQKGRELKWYGQHCSGRNWKTIGICLQGDANTQITQEQFEALTNEITGLKTEIETITKVYQHSDYEPKKPFCAGLSVNQLRYLNTLVV